MDMKTWLKALRLKFYPMSWVTYAIGALAAGGSVEVFTIPVFWAGFAFMLFLEVATVLSNEYYDYQTDSLNTFAGPYSGGSRVLVNGELSLHAMRNGIGVALLLAALSALLVLIIGDGPRLDMAVLMGVLAVLAVGYTVPPLKLSYRTLGELDVALTDSIGVMLCGFVFLGGAWHDPFPWLLSLPLGLAFLPSITLSGIPDCQADRAAGKRTIAVRFGHRCAVAISIAATVLATAIAIAWQALNVVPIYGPLIYLNAVHALVLIGLIRKRLANQHGPCRIDDLMIVSLSFTIWFGVLPLVGLLL